MRCKACETKSPPVERRSGASDPSVRRSDSDQINALLCTACGAVLPPHDPADAMLDKLSQLARFGLGEGVGPLLTSSGGGA